MNSSSQLKSSPGGYSEMKNIGTASDGRCRKHKAHGQQAISHVDKTLREAAGLLRGPQRALPLIWKLLSDKFRITFELRHLYSYARTKRSSAEVLYSMLRWIFDAQRPDGGVAAYYSLLTGYSKSYPEVTGYLIPTLYDFARINDDEDDDDAGAAAVAAARATQWLLSLQMPSGAFPGGLHGSQAQASIFNTGQILQGLIRAHGETNRLQIREAAAAAGDWLIEMQQADGSWCGTAAYQGTAHTYYSMVSWALAELSEHTADHRYARAAEKNLDWVLSHFRPSGWVDGINLRDHPNYLHFIAYALQGVLECGILRRRADAVEAVENSAWALLRKFETSKFLPGAYENNFTSGRRFTCLTGNAQMSCVWLRLFEVTNDLRCLNAALKMNEMLKPLISLNGGRGIAGGVSGSYPVWGSYQPFRYISWGCKFFADALLMEERLTQSFEAPAFKVVRCAS